MDYVKSELSRISTGGQYPARFQIADEQGQTKWINFTYESAKALMEWLKEQADDPANGNMHGTAGI